MELKIRGLKCDTEGCEWIDSEIPYEQYQDWIDKPCPKCGSNSLLTKRDFEALQNLVRAAEVVQASIPPDYQEGNSIEVNMDLKDGKVVIKDIAAKIVQHEYKEMHYVFVELCKDAQDIELYNSMLKYNLPNDNNNHWVTLPLATKYSLLFKADEATEERAKLFVNKVELMIKLVKSFGFESLYGYTYVETYVTPDNCEFKYTGSTPPDISKDGFTKVQATIKHDYYNSQMETKLQRIKILV